MLKLQVLGSSSNGNCYILTHNNYKIILEAGIKLPKLLEALNFNTKNVLGIFITHCHSDHAKYALNYEKFNIPIFANEDTLNKTLVNGTEIKEYQKVKLKDFEILALPASHDVPTLSFLIKVDNKLILFITDSKDIPYNVKNVQHYIIEANYDEDLLKDVPDYVSKRVQKTHMSFQYAFKQLKSDKDSIESITLIHLSDNNSDANKFETLLKKNINENVYIADTNMEIILEE